MKKAIAPIVFAALWIVFSEFIRNQVLFQDLWVEHYNSMGLTFPTAPINGVVWMIWSLLFAAVIYVISSKFSTRQTILLSWTVGFLMVWLVIGNLGVLPYKLLIFAVPLSLLEVCVATLLITKFRKYK